MRKGLEGVPAPEWKRGLKERIRPEMVLYEEPDSVTVICML